MKLILKLYIYIPIIGIYQKNYATNFVVTVNYGLNYFLFKNKSILIVIVCSINK